MTTAHNISPEQIKKLILSQKPTRVRNSILLDPRYNRWRYEFSCGHVVYYDSDEPPKYCCECGRPVIE